MAVSCQSFQSSSMCLAAIHGLFIGFSLNPNSDLRNLPFGPKPVFRVNSTYLFGVEPPPSGWVQHHPELEGDTALSALQRGKVSRVPGRQLRMQAVASPESVLRKPPTDFKSSDIELAPIRTGSLGSGDIRRATLTG